MPEFSVLMSVYYKEKPIFLRESLDSLLIQTKMPNEIVLVKDGPLTDELDQVIVEFVTNHPSVFTVVSLPENRGLANALNEGMGVARNSIIARMDSDDISFRNRFEIQINYLIENDLGIVGGQMVEFLNDVENIVSFRYVPLLHQEIVRFMKFRSPFSHATIVFKKEVFDVLSGYDTNIFPEDYDFFVRAYLAGVKFGNVKDNVYYFRHSENVSQALKRRWGLNYAINEVKIYRKFLKLGFFNYFDFVKALFFKVPLRIIPFKLYSFIYFKFSR